MAKILDVTELLNKSTELIATELEHIEEIGAKQKLSHYDAQDLARYHAVLADRRFQEIADDERKQAAYKNMSDEEYLEMAEKEVERLKANRRKGSNTNERAESSSGRAKRSKRNSSPSEDPG